MWPIHILTRQGADTPLVCPSFFSDTASYRCALGLNHRLFLLTCHPTKKEGKKRPHQSTLLCVKKNKAGGEGVLENDLGYLMSWPCQWFTNSTLIICWSLSFIDFAEDTWHIIPRLPIKQMLTDATRTICGFSISMVKWGRCIKGRIWFIERMWRLVKHRWVRWRCCQTGCITFLMDRLTNLENKKISWKKRKNKKVINGGLKNENNINALV